MGRHERGEGGRGREGASVGLRGVGVGVSVIPSSDSSHVLEPPVRRPDDVVVGDVVASGAEGGVGNGRGL